MAADEMEALADRYADQAVRSVFIYTHEAHPGENYRHHSSIDDKRANARAFRAHSSLKRQILLDDLGGRAHHDNSLLPNMTWIMGRGGYIHYKSAWTAAEDVENHLLEVLDFQENRVKNSWIPFYSERSAWSDRRPDIFKEGLERAGPQALEDYQNAIGKARARQKPSPDLPPKIPGSFYQAEEEQ